MTKGNENNMSFLLVPKSQNVWTKIWSNQLGSFNSNRTRHTNEHTDVNVLDFKKTIQQWSDILSTFQAYTSDEHWHTSSTSSITVTKLNELTDGMPRLTYDVIYGYTALVVWISCHHQLCTPAADGQGQK